MIPKGRTRRGVPARTWAAVSCAVLVAGLFGVRPAVAQTRSWSGGTAQGFPLTITETDLGVPDGFVTTSFTIVQVQCPSSKITRFVGVQATGFEPAIQGTAFAFNVFQDQLRLVMSGTADASLTVTGTLNMDWPRLYVASTRAHHNPSKKTTILAEKCSTSHVGWSVSLEAPSGSTDFPVAALPPLDAVVIVTRGRDGVVHVETSN